MLIPIVEWDKRTFAKRHGLSTLRAWARNGVTNPPAQKVGREWLIDEDAVYVGPDPINSVALSDRALEILNGSNPA